MSQMAVTRVLYTIYILNVAQVVVSYTLTHHSPAAFFHVRARFPFRSRISLVMRIDDVELSLHPQHMSWVRSFGVYFRCSKKIKRQMQGCSWGQIFDWTRLVYTFRHCPLLDSREYRQERITTNADAAWCYVCAMILNTSSFHRVRKNERSGILAE